MCKMLKLHTIEFALSIILTDLQYKYTELSKYPALRLNIFTKNQILKKNSLLHYDNALIKIDILCRAWGQN